MNIFLLILYCSSFLHFRQRYYRNSWSFSAIASDLLASLQLTILSCFNAYSCFLILGLTIPYLLLDGHVHRSVGLRMRFSMIHYLRWWKSFWESAKELGSIRFLSFSLLWVAFSGIFASFIGSSPSKALLGISLFGTIAFLPLFLKLSTSYRHQRLNLFILEQIEGWKALFIRKTVKMKIWQPVQESFFCPSRDTPLFRFTKEFHGEKHFSLLPKPLKKPHVIVVFMESFRAKSVAACERDAPYSLTPCFNQLAKEGIVWRQFYCASARSYKAIIASLYGISCKNDGLAFRKAQNFPLRGLPEILKEEGYFNALLQGGDLDFDCFREFAEAHQFDLVEGQQEIANRFQREFHGSFWGVNDEFLMARGIEVLKQKEQESVPAFINLFTISNHHPWRLGTQGGMPKEVEEIIDAKDLSLESRFEKTLHYSDRCLGSFVQALENEGLLEKSLLFVVGDHGQAFSERGDKVLLRDGLYDEDVKVPLLLLAKGYGIAPKCIDEVASQQDLVATVLDLLDIKTFHHSLGRSLCRVQSEAVAMFHSPFFPYRFGIRKGQWKWIYNPDTDKEELYDLERDPLERKNLAEEQSAQLKALREESIAKKELIETLFEKRQVVPAAEDDEDHILNLSGQRELKDEELIAIVKKMPPTVLKIDDCESISDEAIYAVAPFCKRIKELSLRNCSRISLPALKTLCKSAHVVSALDISHCFLIGEKAIEELFEKPTLIQQLSLEGQFLLEGSAIVSLLKQMPKLRRLSLLETTSIQDDDIASILNFCPELKFLKLEAGRLTDISLDLIAKKAHHLIGIHLVNGREITDAGLAKLAEISNLSSAVLIDCPNVRGSFLKDWHKLFLHSLYLGNFPLLENEALEALLSHPLKHLQLHECPKIQDDGIKRLSELGAETIHVVGCENTTRDAIDYLRMKMEKVFWG